MTSPSSPDDPQLKANTSESSHSADDALPPVQAPSAGFLLQLFFIPLIIVASIVMVWGMFSWLAHMGSDPKDLVKGLKALDDASWQRAYQLSEHLRNPEYDNLKRDPELAGELVDLLESELKDGRLDKARINLRIYLCRALGEFELDSVTDVLVEAATTERDVKEIAVRRSAIEGLATLASHVGNEKMRSHESAMKVLIDSCNERSSSGDLPERDEIRSTAAFALGVIGGGQAQDRLALLLADANHNVRFNAATGLARHGDQRCLSVLIGMLDPASRAGIDDELDDGLKRRQKLTILTNGIFAASRMVTASKGNDLQSLEDALQHLIDSDENRAIRTKAKEALIILRRESK